MNIEIINEGAIIIAPAYFHVAIRKAFLAKKTAIGNIRIVTLSTFLSDKTSEVDESIYEYYQTLKELKNHLSFNRNNATSYSYLKDIMAFINDMKRYDISIDSLPHNNPFEEEIVTIITSLYPIKTNIDTEKLQVYKKLETCSFEDVFIIDESADLYTESIYRLFCTKGATRIHEQSLLQEKKWFHALNARQEIESMAQYIIENQLHAEDIKLSLLDPSYLGIVQSVFQRYQIPCYALEEQECSDLLQRFIALLTYYIDPSTENLKQLFIKHVFTHPYGNDFIQYISLHHFTLKDTFETIKDLNISEEVLSKQEIDKLRQLEQNAIGVKAEIEPCLNELSCISDSSDVLMYIDQFICNSFLFQRNEDRRMLLSIREEIKKSDEYLQDHEDLRFLITLLKNKSVKSEQNEKGIVITSFDRPLAHYQYHFVLGCTQDNYPAFKAKKGIFDENYYRQLAFPSLASRYEFHLEKQEMNLNSSNVLLCFAPLSTIDGKACETSLEMETFLQQKAVKYPIKNTYHPYHRTYEINEEVAHRLFLKENNLHGSISSFERYMSCPYAYYLRYGLKLKEPIDYSFNNAKSGILTHLIMELLVKRYGKQYTLAKQGEISDLLHPYLDEIKQVYPYERGNLKHMEERLLQNIMLNLEILHEQEIHSSLHPQECEHHFDYRFTIDENHQIILHGIIDRIDINEDFLRIIDYKSSKKQLKEELVFSALQLQLITYLIIAQKLYGKRPLGAFYYAFATPNLSLPYGKLKKRPLTFIEYNELDHLRSFYKEGRLNGWMCDLNIEAMDDDGTHIVGVRNSAASGINASTIYNFETLETYFKVLYQIIGERILHGKIDCESAEGACTYCPYANVCAKSYRIYPKDELIEVDASLYQKGGRKNA